MPAVVEVRDLVRVYRSKRKAEEKVALRGVTLTVDDGEILGLLGPNGAGKTTLVKILSTVLLPTSGTAKILDKDVAAAPRAVRENVGVVFGGERGLYPRISARQNLDFWAALYRLDRRTARRRCAELLDRVGLGDRADDAVETFSRGMKQRLHLARGLIHGPRILFFDEPTTGMDPVAAREFRTLVHELRKEGRTVFLTTHDMAEAEALCDRVTLIDHGSLVLDEPTEHIGRYLDTRECVDFSCDDRALLDEVAALPFVEVVEARAGGHRALVRDPAAVAQLLVWLIGRGVLSARRSEPSLEDIYLRLVGTRAMSV
ncbi:ABC transporter ATP-binding protein [Micromonospora sp. CPCC 205546]|uniref:ABC transporter ATP-binding protein n=1 Tax=Micromonospora sp. CPCC 205546 TaxID=3122397 RepID=UPI002FEF5C42